MNPSRRKAWSRDVGAIAAALMLAALPAAVALAQGQPPQGQPTQVQPTSPPDLPAKTPSETPGRSPTEIPTLPRLKLTTQDEYTIREVILTDGGIPKQNAAPENIGDTVPQNIQLRPLPPDVVQKVPKARGHEFFVKDDAVFLVSPSDRRIADVLRKKPSD